MSYAALDHARILQTIDRLHQRVSERFPNASLTRVAAELQNVAREHAGRSQRIHRANWGLRLLSAILILCGIGALGLVFQSVRSYEPDNMELVELAQGLEAAMSMLFLLTAAVLVVASLELRQRRSRCLEALHQLRALAHVVDMHQLTKDPAMALRPELATPSSPERVLTPFELARYLDYCAEMLALMGKLAALYVQRFPDPAAVEAVDAIEDLTTGLSRKVWQKIMILANYPEAAAGSSQPANPALDATEPQP